jgi:hypothetical protein
MNKVSKVFVLVALFAASFALGFSRRDGGRRVSAVPAPAEAALSTTPGGIGNWWADGPCAGGKPMNCLKCSIWGECDWACVGDYFCVLPGQTNPFASWDIPRLCSYHDGRCKP